VSQNEKGGSNIHNIASSGTSRLNSADIWKEIIPLKQHTTTTEGLSELLEVVYEKVLNMCSTSKE